MHRRTELSYRAAAIDATNPFGLMVALYDTLIGDLQRGAEAIRQKDIEGRCTELNHACAVLGELERWVEPEADAALAKSLSEFYAHIRSRIFVAGVRQSTATLETLIELVLQVRASWQQREENHRNAPIQAT